MTNVSHIHTLLSDWPMSAVKHEQLSLQFVSVPGLPLNLNILQPHNWAIFCSPTGMRSRFPSGRPQTESDGRGGGKVGEGALSGLGRHCLHAPLPGFICQGGWQLPLPPVSLPPQRVIANDDAETIVQSEKGLAGTWWKRRVDRGRRQKKNYIYITTVSLKVCGNTHPFVFQF